MRSWRDAAAASARLAASRPELWLAGALAWIASVGWIPLLVAVGRPPSVAELTFLGARLVGSGSWPWNAAFLAATVVALVLLGFLLAAVANAALIALIEGRASSARDVGLIVAVSLVSALPAALSTLVVLLALAMVAPSEFNAPDPAGGPVLSTAARLTPYLVLLGVTAAAGAALAAVAGRLATGRRQGVTSALRSASSVAVRPPQAIHAVVAFLAQVVYLGFGALLLGVLWAPIGARLSGSGEIDVAIGLLLVGFVAIWLCLVLAGGALHAWSAATWSRLLATNPSGRT